MTLTQQAGGKNKEHYIRAEQSIRLLGQDDEFCSRLLDFQQEYTRVAAMFKESFDKMPDSERIYWNTEIRQRQEMLQDFVALLRLYPHMPLKATTNTGDTEALPLDFQGMYEFLKLKVDTAMRLDPEGTVALSEQAQLLGRQYIQNIGGPQVVGQVNELLISPLAGDTSSFIAQNAIYAEKLASTGRDMGIFISPLDI
jgi:hypothetical protein